MVTPNAYSFLPWLRTGLTTKITSDPGTADRAGIAVALHLSGDPVGGGAQLGRDVERSVQIYGPGDVIGVDPRAISRTEPRPWITNVEPNYLAHIEFYNEDFPWRYSPAAPDQATGRLRPWLALVVLAGAKDPGDDPHAEFAQGGAQGGPLPFITVTDPASTLPPPDQLGAWAHVHVDGELVPDVVPDTMDAALPALLRLLSANPDAACARLMCPRRLKPDTTYHAFLVPAFETGRLAGLGLDPATAPGALFPAWGGRAAGYTPPAPGRLPYYFRWFFGTGGAGDFEHLVELLKPKPVDPKVARRDIDVHRPAGPLLPGITTPASIGGVLRLGGALQVPKRPQDAWDTWDQPYPHPFQQAMAGLINLAEAYLEKPVAAAHAELPGIAGASTQPLADEVDPIITPPLYGRWHALTSRLLYGADGTPIPAPVNRNWVHRLNLDPRFRVAANYGTQIVQQRQEEFMAAAWEQVGGVLKANQLIRGAQLAREVGHALQEKHLAASATTLAARAAAPGGELPSGRALRLTAPAGPRVTPAAAAPAAAVRGLRLLDSVADSLAPDIAVGFHVASSRVAAAPVSPTMRRLTRPGSRLMRGLPFGERHGNPDADALLARMDADTDPVTAAPPKTTPATVVTPDRLDAVLHPPIGVTAAGGGADPVDQLPTNANFQLSTPEDNLPPPAPGGQDSEDAERFKKALKDIHQGWDAAAVGARTVPPGRLDVAGTTDVMLNGLRADHTVPKSLLSSVQLPERLHPFGERFIEAMAYPVIDIPMYRALRDNISVDAFVPNIELVPPNSITLLKTNQEFIEAFMVGLNHEMARELLWREYPTDQRGSVFRQFWDPHAAEPVPGETDAQRRERLYDITRIDEWAPGSGLGDHDNRQTGPPPPPGTDTDTDTDEVVLVIRGELLKKYPTAAVYAHKADWSPDEAGNPDPTRERRLADLSHVSDPAHPPTDLVKLPRYEAKVEPDIYLLGFDLTTPVALGDPPKDAGWFFVIKERPGDPRFGADLDKNAEIEVWNDLAWPDVDPAGSGFIKLDPTTVVDLGAPGAPGDTDLSDDPEKQEQYLEDVRLPQWNSHLSSADIAYMLFQAPVLMGVHAQEMLPHDPAQ
jgi:hypothetical protein